MAESFSRWESDPLFSAAEVVQDSADRMESLFRILWHDQSHMGGMPSDPKIISLVQYHRRDLLTALETTRWQLEDFEREVNLAALSDKSNSRANAIAKHWHFIRAIKEQIFQVEKILGGSAGEEIIGTPQWTSLNEQETDGLAQFLSGGISGDQVVGYDNGTSTMRRFLDSDAYNDEIVELKNEEPKILPVNGLKITEHGYSSLDKQSQYPSKYNINGPSSFTVSTGQKDHESSYAADGLRTLDAGDFGVQCYSYRNTLRASVWGFLLNFWPAHMNTGSFTKRRKDGEVGDDLELAEQRISTAANEQGVNMEGWRSASQINNWIEVLNRLIQRSWYLVLYNPFPVGLASGLLVILILIGFLSYNFP